jgi:hypothetical protein
MATPEDYADSFTSYGGNAFEHKYLANALYQRRVPLETVQHINKVRFNDDSVQHAGAYRHTDQSMRFAGAPSGMSAGSPEREQQTHRLIVHEAHHATQHRLNPLQFEAAMAPGNSTGRGRVEGYAEKTAERAVPGSYSPYGTALAAGKPTRFDSASFHEAAGNLTLAPHVMAAPGTDLSPRPRR